MVLIIIISAFCYWQNNKLIVSEYDYKNSKIPESFDGYKIVQISDLHNKMFGKNCNKLISKIKEQSPDIIVITGDLVDLHSTNINNALIFVKQAVSIAPVYYVNGNHESELEYKDYSELTVNMIKYGANVLKDETVIIRKDNDYIYITDLNDGDLVDDTLNKKTRNFNENIFKILLAHEPQFIDNYSLCEMDLVFSGHAHGGQIRLPFLKGLYAPNQGFFPKYTSGKYIYEQTTMFVSQGLGNSSIPVRIFNYPQIITVTLHTK